MERLQLIDNADSYPEAPSKAPEGTTKNHLLDCSFDLAPAFETVYFWCVLEKCFEQVIPEAGRDLHDLQRIRWRG